MSRTARGRHERMRAVFAHSTQDANGCIVYTQGATSSGYRQVTVSGSGGKRTQVRQQAHRFVYEALFGPVPRGLVLDHLCRNRACVNPAHLEAVTHLENVRRGWASRRAAKAAADLAQLELSLAF